MAPDKKYGYWVMSNTCSHRTLGIEYRVSTVNTHTRQQNVGYWVSGTTRVQSPAPKVLITTTYTEPKVNTNIGEGGWYKNNLLLEPFSFPSHANCTP